MLVDKKKCAGCGACIEACPQNAISMVDGKAEIESAKCVNCGRCIQACPRGAIYTDVKAQQFFPPNRQRPFIGYGVFPRQGFRQGETRGLRRGRRRRGGF